MFQAAAVGLPVTERYIGIGLAHSRWLSVWLPVHFLLQACHKATTDHRTKPRSEPDEKDMYRHRQACVTEYLTGDAAPYARFAPTNV